MWIQDSLLQRNTSLPGSMWFGCWGVRGAGRTHFASRNSRDSCRFNMVAFVDCACTRSANETVMAYLHRKSSLRDSEHEILLRTQSRHLSRVFVQLLAVVRAFMGRKGRQTPGLKGTLHRKSLSAVIDVEKGQSSRPPTRPVAVSPRPQIWSVSAVVSKKQATRRYPPPVTE